MGKAINGFIEKSAETDVHVTKLTFLDIFHPKGSREKIVTREKNKQPHEPVVTKIREVTYLYNKKTTKGWEIVEQIMVPRGTGANVVPEVVEAVTRDLRTEVQDGAVINR